MPAAPPSSKPELAAAVGRAATCARLSHRIHANPEPGFEELQAAAWRAEILAAAGLRRGASRGTPRDGCPGPPGGRRGPGPRVASSPSTTRCAGLGHGCGHNMMAASGVGAALALAAPRAIAGRGRLPRHAGRGGRQRQAGDARRRALRRPGRGDDGPRLRLTTSAASLAGQRVDVEVSFTGAGARGRRPVGGQERAGRARPAVPVGSGSGASSCPRRARPRIAPGGRDRREHHPRRAAGRFMLRCRTRRTTRRWGIRSGRSRGRRPEGRVQVELVFARGSTTMHHNGALAGLCGATSRPPAGRRRP